MHRQLWSADHFGVVVFVQVKVLVPNSTAGMIIGKSGNYIKQIKEESGAYVQISQKSKETNLPERCVTIAGEFSLCFGFVFRICNCLFSSSSFILFLRVLLFLALMVCGRSRTVQLCYRALWQGACCRMKSDLPLLS